MKYRDVVESLTERQTDICLVIVHVDADVVLWYCSVLSSLICIFILIAEDTYGERTDRQHDPEHQSLCG